MGVLVSFIALSGGCLDASRAGGSDAAAVDIDGGDRKPFDAGGDADATPDAAPRQVDIRCPATSLAVATIDGVASDTAWDDAGATVAFDAATSNLRSEVPDYQPPTSVAFRCLHTSNTLYMFFDVLDGSGASSGAIFTDATDPRSNDALAIFFDGGGDRSGAYGADDHWLVVDVAEKFVQSDEMAFLAGVTAEAHSVWRLELAVGLDSIAPAGVRSDVIGFDVAIHDEDGFAGGSPDLMAVWRAEVDACLDCCAEEQPAPTCDTSQFGTLALDD